MENTLQKALWQRLQNYTFDDPTASFSFSKRLCEENNWHIDYAKEVIEEYKKFMYLLCEAGHPVTPSDAIDQVWHLHMIYTRLYWEDFCPNVLQKEAHHGPTKGGKTERVKFHDWYSKTLESYRSLFQTEPPTEIWLPAQERFSQINFQRVNMDENWVIPKPFFLQKKSATTFSALLFVPLLGILFAATNVAFYIVIVAIVVVFGLILVATLTASKPRQKRLKNRKKSRNNSSADGGASGCGSDSGSSSGGSSFGGGDSGGAGGDSGCGGGGCGGGCGGGGCGG